MTDHDKVSTHNKRMMIVISCVTIALFMTTGILLTIGTISAQGAAFSAPDAPNVTAECEGGSWNCENVEDPLWRLENMTDRSLRYKSDGTPCVVFGGGYGLYYSCYDSVNELWDGANIPIDDSPLVGEYAALAFNDVDLPFISYYDGANGALKLAYHTGTAWVIDTIVDENTTCTWGDVYAPQTEDTLAGERSAPDSWLEALISGNFWQDKILEPVQENLPKMLAPEVEEVDGVGRYTSIAVDTNGVHISFSDWNGLDQNSLKYYFWDGGPTEKCRVIDDNGSDVDNQDFLWTSIATVGNKVHISYFFDKYDQLRYAKSFGGSAFEVTEIEKVRNVPQDDPGTGAYTSIAVDQDGIPHISYYKWSPRNPPYDGDLMLAYKGEGDHDCSEATTWQCERKDNSANVGGYTSISFDKDWDYIISYYDFANGDLKSYGGYDDGTLYSTGNVGLYTSVDTHYSSTNDKKKIAIAFLDATEGELIVAQNVGGDGWVKLGTKEYVAKFGDVGLYTSLAIRQDDDKPFISYYNKTNGFLKYAFGTRRPGTPPPPLYLWESAAVTDTLKAGTFSAIGIGGPNSPVFRLGDSSDGEPIIALYSTHYLEEEDEEDAVTEDLMYAYRDKTTLEWVFDEVDTTGNVGQYVDLAIDSTGIPHISYYDVSRGALIYATRNTLNTAWITDTLDNNGDVGRFTSIALDPNDLPYVAYYDYTNSRILLRYKTFIGSWSQPSIVATDVGYFDDDYVDPIEADLSLAFEDVPSPGQDQVHVSYFDQIYNDPDPKSPLGDLKYALGTVDVSGAVTWIQYQTLDSSFPVVGIYNDLIVNNLNGERYVCYYDKTWGNLKVAKWDGSPAWDVFIVDSEGDTGLYCSTALESDGEVTISYYDKSRGSLRFAHSPTPPLPIFINYLPIVIK